MPGLFFPALRLWRARLYPCRPAFLVPPGRCPQCASGWRSTPRSGHRASQTLARPPGDIDSPTAPAKQLPSSIPGAGDSAPERRDTHSPGSARRGGRRRQEGARGGGGGCASHRQGQGRPFSNQVTTGQRRGCQGGATCPQRQDSKRKGPEVAWRSRRTAASLRAEPWSTQAQELVPTCEESFSPR